MFPTVEEAVRLYSKYGRLCGFDVRRGNGKLFDRSEDLQSKRLHCHREGFYSNPCSKVANGVSSSKKKRKHLFSRCGCPDMLKIKYDVHSKFFVVTKFVE